MATEQPENTDTTNPIQISRKAAKRAAAAAKRAAALESGEQNIDTNESTDVLDDLEDDTLVATESDGGSLETSSEVPTNTSAEVVENVVNDVVTSDENSTDKNGGTTGDEPLSNDTTISSDDSQDQESSIVVSDSESSNVTIETNSLSLNVSDPEPSFDSEVQSITAVSDNDSDNMVTLKKLLEEFVTANAAFGSSPDDFRTSAKLTATITKHVIRYPKVDILDKLLSFFEANLDGVCDPTNFMKGSTSLPSADEQQVGYLYGLFYSLARRNNMSVNSSQVISVLKKPELANYYQRKTAFFAQQVSK